jgi:hypothetical protein
VIAHPSDSAGARAALEDGVDILAHTFPAQLGGVPWDRSLPGLMRQRGMVLIPTLLPPALVERLLGATAGCSSSGRRGPC